MTYSELNTIANKKGFVMENFAKHVGMTRPGLYMAVKNHTLQWVFIEQICKSLDIDPNTLLSWATPTPPPTPTPYSNQEEQLHIAADESKQYNKEHAHTAPTHTRVETDTKATTNELTTTIHELKATVNALLETITNLQQQQHTTITTIQEANQATITAHEEALAAQQATINANTNTITNLRETNEQYRQLLIDKNNTIDSLRKQLIQLGQKPILPQPHHTQRTTD